MNILFIIIREVKSKESDLGLGTVSVPITRWSYITKAYRWSQIKTRYLHILDFYLIFLNRKVRHFANAFRILKCIKRIIQLLFKQHYV